MIKHIVTFKIKGKYDREKADVLKAIENALKNLEGKVPSLKKIETGINLSTRPNAYDLVLVTEFENEAGLNAYRTHPEHVKVLEFLKTLDLETGVIDYEF